VLLGSALALPASAARETPDLDDTRQPWEAEADATRPLAATSRHVIRLLDDFETLRPWSSDSADDHADLALDAERVSSGRFALRVDFQAHGRGKFQVRRDGRLDLSGGGRLLVDVYNAAARMRIAFGISVERTQRYYESPTLTLDPGWNRDLSVSLAAAHFSLGDEDYRHVPRDLNDTVRLTLVFFEDGNPKGTVFVDNLRYGGPELQPDAASGPVLLSVKAERDAVRIYERIELEIDLGGAGQDFFDPNDIRLWADFYSPSGRKIAVSGFYDGLDLRRSPPRPVWRIRFAPGEGGRWIYTVGARNRFGETVSPLAGFAVESDPKQKGFARISRADPRCFEFANGDFFYPIGQNVAWAANMKRYFQAVSDYGGNVVRVWLAPWHLPVELKREPGRYDVAVARQLDAILDLAGTYNLYVILVLHHHGLLRESWSECPYNSANGGPCTRPEQFFTSERARALVSRKLDYLCARYASYTSLFAWELFNEADFAAYTRFEDVSAWHEEMIGRLRASDPYGRPIATSVGGNSWAASIYSLPGLDFVPAHVYTPQLKHAIDILEEQFRPLGKPVFLGEFGAFTNAADERADHSGVYLHAGLWYSFTTPWAAASLPWWWDVHIEADDLYHHFRALARFAAGEDRRGHNFRTVEAVLPTGRDTRAQVRGILTPSLGYLWIHDAERMADPARPERPVVHSPATLTVDGLLGGRFRIETWNAWTGERISQAEAASRDGRLDLPVPASAHDLAIKLKRIGVSGPTLTPGVR